MSVVVWLPTLDVKILSSSSVIRLSGRLLLSLIFFGGLGLVGATLSFYTALTMAPVNLVIVIAYMYPALVSLLSVVFLKLVTQQNVLLLYPEYLVREYLHGSSRASEPLLGSV